MLVWFADYADTSVGGFADFVFELDRGVVNLECMAQAVIDGAQNRIARCGAHWLF